MKVTFQVSVICLREQVRLSSLELIFRNLFDTEVLFIVYSPYLDHYSLQEYKYIGFEMRSLFKSEYV